MGALPRLKIKDEIRYRKGSTNETRNCKWCASFIRNFTLHNGEVTVDFGSRCKMIGPGRSVRYRVREDHTCDRQVSTYVPSAIGKG